MATSPMIEALLHERAGYAERGLDDRAAEVDAQLAAAGYDRAAKPAPKRERAVKPAAEKRG